jgi:predicted metal-dependent phosphoesterase TrpH
MKALRNPDVAKVLVAIEAYNATILDKASNGYSRVLAEHLEIAQTGSSDAHVLSAIGLGRTEFSGHTRKDLLTALKNGTTIPLNGEEWNAIQILGSWAIHYYGNKLMQMKQYTQDKISIFAT